MFQCNKKIFGINLFFNVYFARVGFIMFNMFQVTCLFNCLCFQNSSLVNNTDPHKNYIYKSVSDY